MRMQKSALPLLRTRSFDCVFVGVYGLRNFPCLAKSLREIERVTRPGGLMVTLDFFLPQNRALRRAYLSYLYAQGAFWGLLLHGRPRTYVPTSPTRCGALYRWRNFPRCWERSASRESTRDHLSLGVSGCTGR